MATYQNNPPLSASQVAAVQQQVQQQMPQARASGNVLAYFARQPWFPAGYQVDDSGKLNYVQVDQSRPAALSPYVALPLIATGGLAAGVLGPASAAVDATSSAVPAAATGGLDLSAAALPAAAAPEAAPAAATATIAGGASGALGTGAAPASIIPATAGGGGVATTSAALNTGGTGSTPSWLAPLIGSGISTAGQLIGAGIQSSGIQAAAQIQAQSTANALAFEKQRYADLMSRLAPYMASGTSASDRMAQLLGLPGASATAPPPYTSYSLPSASSTPSASASAAPASAPAAQSLVTMKAPDGSMQQVNQSDVQHYISKGATVVANA
jgi:hypothetical protein